MKSPHLVTLDVVSVLKNSIEFKCVNYELNASTSLLIPTWFIIWYFLLRYSKITLLLFTKYVPVKLLIPGVLYHNTSLSLLRLFTSLYRRWLLCIYVTTWELIWLWIVNDQYFIFEESVTRLKRIGNSWNRKTCANCKTFGLKLISKQYLNTMILVLAKRFTNWHKFCDSEIFQVVAILWPLFTKQIFGCLPIK